MSDLIASLKRPGRVPDHAAAIAILVQPVLSELIGTNAVPVSLSIEFGSAVVPDESVEIDAQIARGTRTLVFVQARVTKASGQLAADVSAIFRRQIDLKMGVEGMG
ncbi:MAG: hotdog domain-containing protein [Alphaproteobacteria bacterium]